MLAVLALPALAQELPWECPVVVVPADAFPLQTDAGLEDAWTALEAEVAGWWDDGCAWGLGDYEGTEAWTCVTSAGATLYRRENTGMSVVQLPEGAASWTAIRLDAWDDVDTRLAEWVGAPAGLPEDQWFRLTERPSSHGWGDAHEAETPACAWAWGPSMESVFVDVGDTSVWVWYAPCLERGVGLQAYVDGWLYGQVDEQWVLDEVDLDGWNEACGDCDDTDPSRHPLEWDLGCDGIDQDCDGADSTEPDADRDGHDASTCGGDDCDDLDDDVYGGAEEHAGNGEDEDCDGADDVDADDDGWTADGDDRAADCDDDDPDVRPSATDTPGDGLDQDCDGEDAPAPDRDGDGYGSAEYGGPDCDDAAPTVAPGMPDLPCDGLDADCDGADPCDLPTSGAEPACGCRASASAALLLLVPWGRRRRGSTRRG